MGLFFIQTNAVFADIIASKIRNAGNGIIKLAWAFSTIALAWIGYKFKKGKSDASEHMEKYITGAILLALATIIPAAIQRYLR